MCDWKNFIAIRYKITAKGLLSVENFSLLFTLQKNYVPNSSIKIWKSKKTQYQPTWKKPQITIKVILMK